MRLLPLALLLAVPAVAQPAPVAPSAVPFRIGALQAWALRDAGFAAANDGKTWINASTADVAATLKSAGLKGDTIPLGVSGLFVRIPGHPTIIDTGLGPKQGGVLAASVAAAGAKPGEITDIFISHSHFDHVGGLLTSDGKLAFPNASIHMAAAEWAHLKGQPANAALAAAIGPKIKTFDKAGPVFPGLTALPNPGHTPGHSTYRVTSGKATLRTLGDTAHSSIISLAHPDWAIAYDSDKAAGAAARKATLAELAASGERVFAPHFPWPGVGHVVKAGAGFAWQPDASVKAGQ